MNRFASIILFLFISIFFAEAYPRLPERIRINQLSIKSLEQKSFGKGCFCFQGEVEVWVDEKLHIWADIVEIDKNQKILKARAFKDGSIKIENNDFLILADSFKLNFSDKTGFADNVRFHLEEGFLCADSAEKRGDGEWFVRNMIYTPCDALHPHWYLSARSAQVSGGYFIKACSIVFKIGGIPVFYLPSIVFPIQGNSKSGFLMPRFYFDYVYGFGFNLRYYKYLSQHSDTTFSVDWRHKRGFVLSDEFRWAIAPENFLNLRGHYAIARDSFVQKKDKIFKATDHRYWIQGTDFRSSDSVIPDAFLASLVRLDFGTDKKIGYHFFNTTDDVDDEFYNSGHIRLFWPNNLFELSCSREKTDRKNFSKITKESFFKNNDSIKYKNIDGKNFIKEQDVNVVLSYLPRIEWISSYYRLFDIFSYRQDFFIDQVTSWQQDRERFFVDGLLQQEGDLSQKMKADLLRANYRSDLRFSYFFYGNGISSWINPNIQFRSNIQSDYQNAKNVFDKQVLGRGAFRSFIECGSEWAMPEIYFGKDNINSMVFLRPILRWDFIPSFDQNNCHYFDRWDRSYPKNQVSATIRKNLIINDFSLNCNISQSYEFYDQSKIFLLRKGILQSEHLMPLRIDSSLCCRGFSLSIFKEFEWRSSRLLQAEIFTSFQKDSFFISCGYFFQKNELQQVRSLVANIPHIFTLSASIPLTKRMILSYGGQLYSEGVSKIFSFTAIRPLLHRVRLEYNGHCWGFYLGFEEKNYRDSGNWRRDRAMVLGVRIDSIGSFAQKFRSPQNVQMAYDQL